MFGVTPPSVTNTITIITTTTATTMASATTAIKPRDLAHQTRGLRRGEA